METIARLSGSTTRGRWWGTPRLPTGSIHAFITGPDGVGMTDLGTLGGDYSGASGINDAGQVVGVSTTANGQTHAFITGPDGVGMTDLGTLGGDYSYAFGINDAGQVVGESGTDNGQRHAFITGPDGAGMTDLASVVNPPTGFTYFSTLLPSITMGNWLRWDSSSRTRDVCNAVVRPWLDRLFSARASNCIGIYHPRHKG